jgi:hypothetical protein
MKRHTTLATVLTLGFSCLLQAAQPPAQDSTLLTSAKVIDSILEKEWKKQKLQGNAPASDDIFVRRIYLDVVGRIPTYREAEEFAQSTDKAKRTKLIDRLLASEGYVQNMYNYWADVLRLQTNGGQSGAITGAAYANFIKKSLKQNMPYDQFVRELVGAHGLAWKNGAIGYYMRDRGMPLDNMAATVRVFLGTRIECAQCHDHPFDKWKQKQFYEMAAFTYGVDTNEYNEGAMAEVREKMRLDENAMRASLNKKNMTEEEKAQAKVTQEKYREQQRFLSQALQDVRDPLRYTALSLKDRKLTLPHDYQYPDAKPKSVVMPATMMGHAVDLAPGVNAQEAYAKWMTSKDNARFNTVIANRLWKKVFGLALIEPLDELMDTTVPSNPELMAHLERLIVSLNYDTKAFLRVLLNTQTYQRSVTREEIAAGVPYYFTGPLLRRMNAEQMWDSFVTLINPTPDMPNYVQRDQSEKRIAGAKQISDSLEALGPDGILKGAEVSAQQYRENAEDVKKFQRLIAEAREAGDKDKAKQLGSELNKLTNLSRASVKENVLVPAAMKLASLKGGKAGDKVEVDGGSSMMMSGDTMMIPGFDRVPETPKAMTAEQEKQLLNEATYFGITDPKAIKSYVEARKRNIRTWLRAAEIESPAPRGHYLREFGQSDREVIENANSDASVPQALVLMNSSLLPQIMEKNSSLMLTINKMPYPEEKIQAAYMTLLSRKPTARELEIWQKASEKGLDKIEDLIYSLINTQQFIFIQ